MLRDGTDKLIYHVEMPPQLFDLASDPQETQDLATTDEEILKRLEGKLRQIVDPEDVDRRAKSDQRAHMARNGGADAIRKRGTFNYSPVPGDDAAMESLV